MYCIQLQKDQRLDDPATAFRSGLYVGFCKGVVYAREETGHNVDAEIERLWAAFAQEIAQSPPRHCQAPMPARMMSRIDRPIGEILGAGPDRRATGRSRASTTLWAYTPNRARPVHSRRAERGEVVPRGTLADRAGSLAGGNRYA